METSGTTLRSYHKIKIRLKEGKSLHELRGDTGFRSVQNQQLLFLVDVPKVPNNIYFLYAWKRGGRDRQDERESQRARETEA